MVWKVLVGLYAAFLVYLYVDGCVHNIRLHRLVVRSEQIQRELQIDQQLKEDALREEAARREAGIDAEFRSFVEKDAPAAKRCLDGLRAEAESQKVKEDGLRRTLQNFGRDPDSDEDFKKLCKYRQELLDEISNVSNRLVTAYIASVKYSAAPSRQGMFELRENALQEGIASAAAAYSRYEKLKGVK